MNTNYLFILSFFVITGLLACKSDAVSNQLENELEDISGDEIPVLNLREENEEGDLLTIEISVLDKITELPIDGAEIFLYHADENGDYLPKIPGDETTAKYSGRVSTSEDGKCVLKTIVPRKYETNGNQHIHLHSVSAESYKNKGGVILFEHDVNDEVREWANETGFGYIIKLTEGNESKNGNLTIYLEKE